MLKFIAILGCARLATSLALSAPQPTSADDERVREVIGWSPRPTQDPIGLFKREFAGPKTCGYYDDGFGSTETITCNTGTCMALAPTGATGMVGCCASIAGGMDYQECGWVKRCYDYSDVVAGVCGELCQINNFNRVCSASTRPYCQSWTYPGLNAQDFGCNTDPASTWITVSSDVADVVSGTATAQLQFVPAAATVTGLDDEISSGTTTRPSSTNTDSFTSTSFPDVSSGSRAAAIVTVVIILVLLVGSYCAGACIVFYFCKRSKRLTEKWKSGSSVALVDTRPPHTASSNVMPPPSSYDAQQPFSPLQSGAGASYYGRDEYKFPVYTSPQSPSTPVSAPGTPAPTYSQNQLAHITPAQPYHPPPNSAVEAPANHVPTNPAPRPNYAELG